MVLVDTSVWVDYFAGVANPETEWLDFELDKQRLGVADLNLCEILQGLRSDAEIRQVQRQIVKCEIFDTGGEEMAVSSAENFRLLRKRGFTVRKTIDCWVATFCLREGHTLLHRDRDFSPFEKVLGLRVVQAR